MPALKHPITGAIYSLRDDGLVDVENNGLRGVFDWQGKQISGDLQYVDVHMLVWIAGPQLADGSDTLPRHRAILSTGRVIG